MHVAIAGVSSYVPPTVLTNEQLATELGKWTAEQIEAKTGIAQRHVAAPDETVSEMSAAAVQTLLDRQGLAPEDIGFLVLCTQTPDYLLPTTACLVQDRVGLPTTCAAYDINLGCSGYVYGLAVAGAMIEAGLFDQGVLVTADTYTRYIHPQDGSARTLFGDAATATLLRRSDAEGLGPFVFGTDGAGAGNFIIPASGTRVPRTAETARESTDESGNTRTDEHIRMHGSNIFTFALQRIPPMVTDLLARSGLAMDEVDLFVFHQANKFMLDHLRTKLRIPAERFIYHFGHVGNTVSSSIPVVLEDLADSGKLSPGQRVAIAGFGVGYSWAAGLITWR